MTTGNILFSAVVCRFHFLEWRLVKYGPTLGTGSFLVIRTVFDEATGGRLSRL
jgi:hypothetical protein